MNKWQIICPLVALLIAGLVVGSIHLQGERRELVHAVNDQLNGYSPRISSLRKSMRTNDIKAIEDAVYRELPAEDGPLQISRSMIKVARSADGSLECVIDVSSVGMPPWTNRSSSTDAPR